MANVFDDPFSPADTTAADNIFNPAQPRTIVSPGLTSFGQNPLDDPMSGLFNYDEPVDVKQTVAALTREEEEDMTAAFDAFAPKEEEDSIGLLSSPKDPKLGPTEFQKKNVNWSDGGRDERDPLVYPASDADFLEVDYMYGKKEGASGNPVLAANVFGRQFTAEELNRDSEGRRLLDLMQKRRSGEYSKGGTLANLAKGFGDWSKSDIPYYGWVSDIGASAGEAIEISETLRRLQDGKSVSPHQVLQARRFMLQQELEAQRTAAYQVGAVARQAIPFMAEMFAESLAVAGIVGVATGGVGAVPGAIVGAAIAPAKLLFGLARGALRKAAPRAIAKVTDREMAKLAAKGITYGAKDFATVAAKGAEVYGSKAARREAFKAFREEAARTLAAEGRTASAKEITAEATRLMADQLSRRAPEHLSPQVAARMMYGADYRTGAETAITRGLEEMALRATNMEASEFAKLSGRARAKKVAEGWAKISQADRDKFLKEMLNGLKKDKQGTVLSGIEGFSSAKVKAGMEATTGTVVGEKYARSVADQVARQVMNAFDLRYGDRALSHIQRVGGWFGEHVTRGFLQSEHAYFAGGLPTLGHAGFSSFHLSSDALKEGLGRVFVEAPIQGAMNAVIGPVAFAPIFAAASGHNAGDAVFKGQLGFQANALLTGDRRNMETARQCAIGSLFVEYMSESAGRGLGIMAGGALASNPVARAVLGTKTNPVTGTTKSIVGGVSSVWDKFLQQPLTKQAGSLLSKATEAVYGFGRMGVDKYSGLATAYVTKLVKAANRKGVAGTVSQVELKNAITSKSLEGLNDAVRGILASEGIRTAKQLARRVALDASHGDRVKAFANIVGLKLAQKGLTPDEIVRKFRQMGKGGIIEEMGEERLGDFVRGLFHLDETASDADISEHVKSMFSGFTDPKQLMVEFFGFAWPGIVRSGAMRMQRWISTGHLAEARERSARIRNVMDIMGSSRAAMSVVADERRQAAINERTAEGQRLLTEALGTTDSNDKAVLDNAQRVFEGRANLENDIKATGGLQAPATAAADGTQTPGTSDFNNSKAKVDAVIAAKTEAEVADELAKLAQSYMQYSTPEEFEDALKQTGASVLFGADGVKAIRKEWRKIDGHRFADGHEIEQSLEAYKTFMNTAADRVDAAPATVADLANQVRVESPIFSQENGTTASQREGLSQEELPLVDEGITSQLQEDLKELARNVNRAALSIDGDMGFGRRAISKIVGLMGAAATGDVSLAMMNPAAWQARDSGISPELLIASNGYYVESLIEGFKKLRVGENGLEPMVAEKLQAAIDAGGDFASAIKRAVETGELKTQTVDAMEEAGAELFDSRIRRLSESVLAGSGIIMVAQDQQNEAVLNYVASKHRAKDGDRTAYALRDGSTVEDFHDPRFAESWVAEIKTARDDLVDELLRLAADRDALRYSRSTFLGSDRPFFALDVVRAIKNGTKAEMLGAILSLPSFRDMAKVLNISELSEYERETLFSAMNCKDVDLTALANVDDTKDLDGRTEEFVASAMGRNNSKYTAEENQKAMKDFVRRCRLLYRGGITTFTDRDGEGRTARIVPENSAGTRTFRAVVYKAGASLLDQTFTDFAAAKQAILDFGIETDAEGEISKWGFSEVPKNMVISDLNAITSTDSTSMVSYMYGNDRDILRREYLRVLGGADAVRADRLDHDPNERTLPPYLRKKADGSGWQLEGPDAAQKAAVLFKEELARARFHERNKGNVQLWARGENLTTNERKALMDADAKVAESVKAYEAAGDKMLQANGFIRTATPGNQTLGIGNAWTAHLNYTTVRNGSTIVISPDFASDGHAEGMLRYGIRQALDSWRGLNDEDAVDRNLLLAFAYREFKRCGNELADRLDRTDRPKAQRVRDVMQKVLGTDVACIRTSSVAAIASSSVFFSCDRGLMQEGNGFFDGPEMAAIADAFRATPVFPLFASAIDEALGGTGFFHQEGEGSVNGLSAWADAFGRDGLALEAARKSTVFGDGKSARNPALVRYAIRADVTTPDMLDAGPVVIDRKVDPVEVPNGIDADGLVNRFGGENALMDYLKALSDVCVAFTGQYAGIRGGTGVRLTTAQVYRMAVRSNMLGGATTASGGARAKIVLPGIALNRAAVNEARNIELKGMPFELTPETAQHFGAALRRIALASGMSVTRGRTRLINDLRDRNVPEDIIAKVEQAYNETDLKSDVRQFERKAEENRRRAKEETARQDELDEAEAGRSDDGFKEERNIAGLVDNDDTTALSKLLRWYFPWEGGSVSATLSRVRDSLLDGEMLTDRNVAKATRMSPRAAEIAANVKRFTDALSVMRDKTTFDENNAKSVFWSEDAAEVSAVLDDTVRVLSAMGKYDYAVALAAVRDIPPYDGRRTNFLQMLAQMTVTDPMYLERDSEFEFSLDHLGSLVESDRTPNAIQDVYTSLLTVNTLTATGAKLSLNGKDPESLAKGIVGALKALSYRKFADIGTAPTQWEKVNDLLLKNFVALENCPKFKYPGGTALYSVAVDENDLAALQAYLNGETSFTDDAMAALDNIQNLVWERMQNMAQAVDRIFGSGTSLASALRSRDAIAAIRRQADRALSSDVSRDRIERRLRRELLLEKNEAVPEDRIAAELEKANRIRQSGVERLLQMANYFAVAKNANKGTGMWNATYCSAFLSDVVQEPLAQLAMRLGGEAAQALNDGFLLGTKAAALERAIAKELKAREDKGEDVRLFVRRQLRDIGMMKAATGRDVAKALTPEKMDTDREGKSMYDATRILDDQCLKVLIDAYVSSLPQSSRSLAGHSANRAEAAKNRSVMTLPSDLPADIRMENHELFNDVKVDGKSLREILEENGGRWADGSRLIVTVVGAKDVDGTLVPKEYLAGILDSTIRSEFENGNPTHVLMPFFRADKPSCFAIRMPVRVAEEWVRQVSGNEKLMANLKPELAERIRTLKDAMDGRVPQTVVDLDDQLASDKGEEALRAAVRGAHEGIAVSDIVADLPGFFTPEEVKQIETAVAGAQGLTDRKTGVKMNPRLRVVSATRTTDPAFYAKKCVEFLRKNAEKPFTDPTRVNAFEVWSKHDGMPIREILEACREYKCAPVMSFSISTLGNTPVEKGVLAYNDLLDRIEALVKAGVLEPKTTTIRIDPILPGVTKMEDVAKVIARAKAMGIRKFVTSLVQTYDGSVDRSTGKDRSVVPALNQTVREMTGADYDWDRYYGRKGNGKVNFTPKAGVIREWATFFADQMKTNQVLVQSCAMEMYGLKPSACLDPVILAALTKCDKAIFTEEDGGYQKASEGQIGGRSLCGCMRIDGMVCRAPGDPCYSSCAYCYAGQFGKGDPIVYYNEDGSLVDRPLTRTERPKKGSWKLTPSKPGRERPTAKDERKFNQLGGITKYLGFGKPGSSTDHYGRTTFKDIANTGTYAKGDVVGVSVNGRGADRLPLNSPEFLAELGKATAAGVTFVADTKEYRDSSEYNIGEHELSKYLREAGYVEDNGSGIWRPKATGETPVREAQVPEGVAPSQTVDRDSLYRAAFGLAMTAAGQADIDPKRVATTLSTGIHVPLYKPADENDTDSACYFVSTLGGTTAASLTGAYQIVGRGSKNVKTVSEGKPEAQKLHITSHTLGVSFKKGQGNDYGLGFDTTGYTTTLAAVRYYQEQGRRELERILGLTEGILDPVEKPKPSKDKAADKAKMDEWTKNVKTPHDEAVRKATDFLDRSTVVLDDLETNKAGIFGSSFGFAWDGKSDFTLSLTTEKTNEQTGEKVSETCGILYRAEEVNGKKVWRLTDLDGNALSGGWNVTPDAKNGQMPVLWALSALCMAKKDGKITNADVGKIVANWRLQNGTVTTEQIPLKDTGVLAKGDEFNFRNDGNGNAVATFKTRNISAQIVANNANSSTPEYGHSFATNATRDMEMLEEIGNAHAGTDHHDFVDAHAGYSMLVLAMIRNNPQLVSTACGQDRDLVEAYMNHPFDPEVRDTVAQKVNAFLRREAIIGFYGTHGVMCPSAGNGHSPVSESRGSHTVKIEWLPGTTQYDKDIFRPARIYDGMEKEFYGQSRSFGSGCVNVRAKGFRFGLYLDEQKFDKLVAGSAIRDDFGIDAKQWAAIEGCTIQEAEKAVKLANFIRIATKDEDTRTRLLGCFTDYTGRSAAESEGSKDARFDDLFRPDGSFDLGAIGIGRSRRNSVNERDSAEGSIYLGGSFFAAHRSPSGNIESFQGTVRATAPISFDAETGRIGGEAKYALDPVTMLLQGSDTDGDSAGLQYFDYEIGSEIDRTKIRDFVEAVMAGADALELAKDNGWTETEDGVTYVKQDVLNQFSRAAFVAQVENYRNADTFHQGQVDEDYGTPGQSADYSAPDVWSGAEFVEHYEYTRPDLMPTRELDGEFVCDYGWAGRQPVGTDSVWDEKVDPAQLGRLNKGAKDVLAELGDVSSLTYDKLLKKFVDAAKYGEKTSDLLDPEKSAMLSDAASDSAKARGISVFHQSRFLRALARAVVDGAELDLVSSDGYAPIVDLTSHFDGISNNLFDTLKMMFATRAGWTQQMLPFLLGQIVKNASKNLNADGKVRIGNAFVFTECANFLADLKRESTIGRIARYLHPTKGRQAILADAAKAGIAVSQYRSVTEIAETYCRVKKIKIRDGVDENGKPRNVTPRGKKALIVCANRMVPTANGFDIEKSKPMQEKEKELLAIQGVLDDVREFGELVDYMVDAGRDTAGQMRLRDKVEEIERPRGEVETIQEFVVSEYADLSVRFTDSVAHVERLSREIDDRERPEKGEERARWYEERRAHPIATGVELAENMQRLAHLLGAAQYAGSGMIAEFGSTTREFVENFADAVRYLSNDAWRRYDGRSNRLIGEFFRSLEAKDGRIDVRCKQNEASIERLRAGFDSLMASAAEFTMCYRRAGELVTVKLPGSTVAALLMLHASATRPFGATTSYAGQSNLAAAFGDERIRGLESFAAKRQSDVFGMEEYVKAARLMPVKVTGGAKAYDFVTAVKTGLIGTRLEAKDKGRSGATLLSAMDERKDANEVYAHLADNFGAKHRRAESLKGEHGETVTVSEPKVAPTVAEWAGTELKTRTRIHNVAGIAVPAFFAYPGSKAYTSPEEAYNARLGLEELNSMARDAEGEVEYLKRFYADNGNRASSDAGNAKARRLTDIIADAAARDLSVWTTIASAKYMYVIHRDDDMTKALNRVRGMIVDGSIERPSSQQAKARMASTLGGDTQTDAEAVRADFLARVANTGFRGADPEQLKKTIPQAIADGFRKAFGDEVEVTQVKNSSGDPTNLMKVVRTMKGGRRITTYVSYGDVLGLEGVSRDSRIDSLLDMLNGRRASEGKAPLTREDLDRLSGHDLDALIESFRLAGCQAGQSDDAADLGFAPVMSGVIRLSTDAGFDTLFHEYFHQMLKCFTRFGVYDDVDRAELESKFRRAEGAFVPGKRYSAGTRVRANGKDYEFKRFTWSYDGDHDHEVEGWFEVGRPVGDNAGHLHDVRESDLDGGQVLGGFDEEAAADAYARFVTGSVNGWDELKLKDYCAASEETIRVFSKFRTAAEGLSEAMSRGMTESGLPLFVYGTMFFGHLTNEQAVRLTEPSDEQLARFEDFLLKQRGQFAMTTGVDAGQMSRIQTGVATVIEELSKDEPDQAAVRAALDGIYGVANEPVDPAVSVSPVREADESYETIAGKTSQFLKLALTRFRRDGYGEQTAAQIRRYAAERVNGSADASEVVYAARRLIREVAAVEGYVLEDADGNLTSVGKKLLDDHNVAELALRLIANTEEERQRETAGKDENYAHHAGADFTFARALEHVAPRAYWRFCKRQAELSRDTFLTVANRLETAAAALRNAGPENDAQASSYEEQAVELRGLAMRVVSLAMHVANGDDMHCWLPDNPNTGNLHGLMFKMFTGGARFGEKHGSSDGISRYDTSLGYDFKFDMDDPTITAAFDYAAMSFFVAEAARKYSSLMDQGGRDRTAEGVGNEVESPAEEETPAEAGEEAEEGEQPAEPTNPEATHEPTQPGAEPVAPEIAEGGEAGREREISAARQARAEEELAELAYEPETTPDWILSNPGTWLDQDLQGSASGVDIRSMLTDHNVQSVCEEGFSFASMFNQTFGLETWVGDSVREMKRKVSGIGVNEEGDFAKTKGRRAATVFSNVNGALLGMIAWGEKRVGEKIDADDQQMANWTGQTVRHLAARERRHITGVEIRSLCEERDIVRLDDANWRREYSPAAIIRRHQQNQEQKRTNPETALDVMLYRLLVDIPLGVLGVKHSTDRLTDGLAGGLYFDTVAALVRGKRNAEGLCDHSAGETPAYQHFMVKALQDKYLVASGGDGRKMIAVPLNRSMAAWQKSEMYRKLKKAGRSDQLLNPYYWANLLAKQYRRINQAAAKSRYLTTGIGSNITLAGTSSYWFYGGTGAHAMNVRKYQNAMEAIGDMQESADEILQAKERTLFDILENVDQATLNDAAFASDGSSLVKDRPLKYLAYMMGLTNGHNDSTFDVQRFVRDICDGKYANADHGVPLHADMKVLDVYMAINRSVSEKTVEELAQMADLGPARKQDLVDRMAVSERLTRALQDSVPGTIVGRTEEQEFATSGRLGDSATAGESLVRMCRELVTAERFRGGLAQMLLTVADDGTPNYIVNPTDAVVAVAGLSDEYWGAVARFAVRHLRFRFPTIAYDEGKSGIANMRDVYEAVRGTIGGQGRSEYHGMDVTKMKADRMFAGILCRNSKLDTAGNSNILTDLQKGEADCYMRQLFAILKSPSIDSKWQKLDRAMSWTKIASVGFSAFFNIATVFESSTAASGFWHTIMGMTKTGAGAARLAGRIARRKGGTGAFTSDALFMKDLAQYLNSDDPFVRKARELCDLIGMPLDFTLHFRNDRDNANPVLGQAGVVKGDIEKVVRWATNSGMGAGKVRLLRKSLQFMYEHPTDYTFNVVLNAVKMSVVMQTMRRLREECLRGNRPFDPIRELRRHSAYINAEIGGIDPARYAWATPEMRKILSLGMFSWQWTVGAWVAGGGEAITDAVFGGHSSSPEQRQRSFIRWLRMLGIVKFGVPVFLQAAVKALSKAMSAGLPPDDELKEDVETMPWFCPLNESKVGSLNFDVTPLLKIAARVPGVSWAKENVPVIGPMIPAYVGGGRNTTGKRRYYMHFGKQSDEFFRWFEDPLSQALAKTSIPVQKAFEGIFGGLNPQGYRKSFADKSLFDRVFNKNFSADGNAVVNFLTSMTSFSSQSISANPDAGFLAAVGPMKMGESKRSARLRIVARLRDLVEDDRTNNPWSYVGNRRKLNLLCADIFREAQLNGIPPDKLMSSALGDLAKEQYDRIMEALPKDLKSNRIDGEKVVEAIRALTRINREFSDIKSAMLQRYKDSGNSLERSPAMRRTVLDLIRASRRDPLRFTGEDAESLVERYRSVVGAERRSTKMAAKGGENFGNFLATDEVPATLFGVPVVGAEGHTEADLAFFREHPDAGGFYEMGNEGPDGETPPDGTSGADKNGPSAKPRTKVDVTQRAVMRSTQDSAVARALNRAIDGNRRATGRELHEASYTGYAGGPGVTWNESALKAESKRRWKVAQERRGEGSTLKNRYAEGAVTHVSALPDGKTTGVYSDTGRMAVPADAPREEFVGHPANFDTADRRRAFAKTFVSGGTITNKDADGNPIGTLTNYVAASGNERNAAMSAIFPYAAAKFSNRMNTPEALTEFWSEISRRAHADSFLGDEMPDVFSTSVDVPRNGQGLIRAYLEAEERMKPVDGKEPDVNTPEYREAKELIDWLHNADEMNKLTKVGTVNDGTEVA